jgi:hypothetical protein
MAFNVTRTLGRVALPQPELLKWPLSTARIPSVVVNATGVAADSSGPYEGRRYLLAGTILSKRGDGQYERFTAAGGQAVAAVLFRTTEFADGTDKSDKPVAILDKDGVYDFDKLKIVDFATHEAALRAAFTKSNFD